MKFPFALTCFLAAGLVLAGCAIQPKEQLAAVRAAGVSPTLLHKLEHWGRLSPADIIELKRRHVNDAVALRQLDCMSVDYVVDKGIVRQLRKAGVSEVVITATINAGERFADQFQHPYYYGWYGPWAGSYPYGYPYDPYFYGDVRPYPHFHHHGAVGLFPPGPHR